MKINKVWLIFLFRWLIPSLIAVGFLLLPDLVAQKSTNPLFANLLVRIFFVVYLINPFVGIARVLDGKKTIEEEIRKPKLFITDEDTISIMQRLAIIFGVVSTSVVCFIGVNIFFPTLSSFRYVYPSVYAITVTMIALYGVWIEKEAKINQ